MPAKIFDLVIEQGATLNYSVTVLDPDGTPKDLTGFTGRMQIREAVSSVTTLVDATTVNGMVTVNIPDSQVIVNIPASTTNGFTWDAGVYDLEIENAGGYVIRLVRGRCSLNLQVTR